MNPRLVPRLILALAGTAGAAMPAVAVAPLAGSTKGSTCRWPPTPWCWGGCAYLGTRAG